MATLHASWGGASVLALLAACTTFVGEDPDLADPGRTSGGADASTTADGASNGGSSSGGLRAGDAGEADGSVPGLPPVETLIEGLADVQAFSIDVRPEGDRLVYVSSSEGLVQCALPGCAPHVVLVPPGENLQAEVLAWQGRVYFVERYQPFPPFALYYQRVQRAEGDGGSVAAGVTATSVISRLAADSTGVFVAHVKNLGDDGFDDVLTRVDNDGGAVNLVTQRTGVAAPFVLAKSGELTAIARRATAVRSTLERITSGVATGAGTTDTVVSLAVDNDAVYAASATRVARCVAAVCSPMAATVGDAGNTFGPVDLTGGRLLVVRGNATSSELLACRVNSGTCDVVPDTGLVRITDVQVLGGRWYVLGTTAAAADGGVRWAIRRLNFSG